MGPSIVRLILAVSHVGRCLPDRVLSGRNGGKERTALGHGRHLWDVERGNAVGRRGTVDRLERRQVRVGVESGKLLTLPFAGLVETMRSLFQIVLGFAIGLGVVAGSAMHNSRLQYFAPPAAIVPLAIALTAYGANGSQVLLNDRRIFVVSVQDAYS